MFSNDSGPSSSSSPSSSPESRRAHRLPSFDLYGDIHRALRAGMTDLMVRMGRTDPADEREVLARLDELEVTFDTMASHIAHEATFLHVALERRLTGGSIRIDIEHAEHARAMEDMKALAGLVRLADGTRRAAMFRRLYLRYTEFVGESLVHMSDEETRTQTIFDDLFTAEELRALYDALVASIPPPEMMRTVQAMLAAVDPSSRVRLLSGAKASMPAPAFEAFFPVACARLGVDETADLLERLSDAAAAE